MKRSLDKSYQKMAAGRGASNWLATDSGAAMTSRQRLITALEGGIPDRLPVTTHHLMPSFLKTLKNGMSNEDFFEHFGLDPIQWVVVHRPDPAKGQYFHPEQEDLGFLGCRYISHDHWRLEWESITSPNYVTVRYCFVTPKGTLDMVLQSNEHTTWVSEHLVKNKRDIDLLAEFMTAPLCDVDAVNRIANQYGRRGLIRGHICCFDVFGQPGTWQDAACLLGIERLIMETYDDPDWVHHLLKILHRRKKTFITSLAGASYDILELGGGDASSTVISPKIFDEFVAPYDADLIEAAHWAGQRISYHTCGGMMPFLERLAAMKPDAVETFTPVGMGGDARLAEARTRIPTDICMIGGFDQFHFFTGCSEEDTRREVRRCFDEAGKDGAYILCPSDHFFEAEEKLLYAFADEARKCIYST